MNAIKLISFDADQTLFDFQRVMKEALMAVTKFLGEAGILTTPEVLKETRDGIAKRLNGQAIDMLELRRLSFVVVTQGDEKLVNEAMMIFQNVRFGRVYFYPTVEGTLAKLAKNFKIGLITNGNSDPKRAGIDHLFDHIILGEMYTFKKPDPRIFLTLFDALGVSDPNTVLHVGDSLSTDISGANGVGARSVWFNPDGRVSSGGVVADYTISVMSEVLDIVGVAGR